jgi:hypothetical protein
MGRWIISNTHEPTARPKKPLILLDLLHVVSIDHVIKSVPKKHRNTGNGDEGSRGKSRGTNQRIAWGWRWRWVEVALEIGGRPREVSIHATRGLTQSHGDLDVAQAGPSLLFNVDQKKLPPALRIAAVQAIVALAICASFAIVLATR